jgi:hypothetical protein
MKPESDLFGKYPDKKSMKSHNRRDFLKSAAVVTCGTAGVFAGYFDKNLKGKEGSVFEARRIWYWDGACSLSQIALEGVSKPENCKFSVVIEENEIVNVIETLTLTEKALNTLNKVSIWKS